MILQLVSKGCPIRCSDFSKILRACSLVKVNINKNKKIKVKRYTILGINKNEFTVKLESVFLGKQKVVIGKFPNSLFQCFMFEYAKDIDLCNSCFNNVLE